MEQPTTSQVINTISNLAGIPAGNINPDQSLQDLGMTSILAVQLVSKLEEQFGFEANLDEMQHCNTISDIVNYVKSRSSAN
ncbi:acyl carrier protein [Chitinophaga sp. Hz27]|uniref:acyl carrier protein n=1 Tax=Chitinophaga sp. Hz27 TaxID=3347169 RepID=UPI0035DF6519